MAPVPPEAAMTLVLAAHCTLQRPQLK